MLLKRDLILPVRKARLLRKSERGQVYVRARDNENVERGIRLDRNRVDRALLTHVRSFRRFLMNREDNWFSIHSEFHEIEE